MSVDKLPYITEHMGTGAGRTTQLRFPHHKPAEALAEAVRMSPAS
jgi:hypothetical protein